MQAAPGDAAFYGALPTFDRFDEVTRPAHYHALPGGWWVGITDVVDSTSAIAQGRYKTVNIAGASAISAVMNALAPDPFPFVFGGDGATFAVWPSARAATADALARTVRWVSDEFSLELRAALVPVGELRKRGLDVAVARFRASAGASYAMFAGGGVAAATEAMKNGRHRIEAAPPGDRPDLSGLSCRWTPIAARHGAIVSLIVQPRADVAGPELTGVLERVLRLVAGLERQGHPVPLRGPGFAWPPEGLDLEARASREPDESVAARRFKLRCATALAFVLDRTGWKVGGFDPVNYRVTTSRNTDYRKFDDALRLTIDCDDATLARIEAELRRARDGGMLDYGIHRQSEALMTCIVASFMRDDHVHFVDGADGGYTRAALAIKAAQAALAASG